MISGGIFDYSTKKSKLDEINLILEDPNIWNDPQQAKDLGVEKKRLEDVVLKIEELDSSITDHIELLGLAIAEADGTTILEIQKELNNLEQKLTELEFRRMFHNPMDPNNCFIDVL